MDTRHHMASTAVRELDLSTHANSIADRINTVPGLKTSTAFFTFLRDNLVLNPSAMSSNTSTPYLAPSTSQTLPPPSPSPLAAHPAHDPLDGIPPLSLEVLSDKKDKVDALRLVADSIAQQRQQAALSLVFHPFCLAGLVGAFGMVYQYAYVWSKDVGKAVLLSSSVLMTYLLAIRYLASGYIKLAEQLDWSWLTSDDSDEDIVLGAKFGDELIGATVLRLEPSSSGKKKGRGSGLKGGKGVIRAWTTKLKYRHKGVGGDMLQEAAKVTKEKCGKDAEVGFAKEHANSTMLLPEIFNGSFRKRERRAAKALDSVLAEMEGAKKKR